MKNLFVRAFLLVLVLLAASPAFAWGRSSSSAGFRSYSTRVYTSAPRRIYTAPRRTVVEHRYYGNNGGSNFLHTAAGAAVGTMVGNSLSRPHAPSYAAPAQPIVIQQPVQQPVYQEQPPVYQDQQPIQQPVQAPVQVPAPPQKSGGGFATFVLGIILGVGGLLAVLYFMARRA